MTSKRLGSSFGKENICYRRYFRSKLMKFIANSVKYYIINVKKNYDI